MKIALLIVSIVFLACAVTASAVGVIQGSVAGTTWPALAAFWYCVGVLSLTKQGALV